MTFSKHPASFNIPSARISRAYLRWLVAAAILCAASLPAFHGAGAKASAGQTAAQSATATAPNSDPVYQQLRNVTPGGKTITVKDFVLKRDAGTFTFKSGNFFFLTPVQGMTTGAVFIGAATFSLDPPLSIEKHSLELLTKSSEMVEQFSLAVFRFTDGTEEDVEAKGSLATEPTASSASEALSDVRKSLRKDIQYNLDARILEDVLNTTPGGFFCAFIKGQKYSGKEIYVLDPHGVPADLVGRPVAPEEVAFSSYAEKKEGVWAAFHFSDEYRQGAALGRQPNNPVRIREQKLDVTIEKHGTITGTASTTIVSLAATLRVIPLNLFSKLRVKSVVDENQQPLSFIQEKKEEDAQFAVILREPLAVGKRITIITAYSGPDAVINEGGGNYYPVARESWYPNTYLTGNYVTYDMTFRIPKGLTMVAPGTRISDTTEGDHDVSQWKTEVPIPLASFNFGRFKEEQANLAAQNVTVEAYANMEPGNLVRQLEQIQSTHHGIALGTMSTTSMMKKALGEGQLAVPLYTDYFGPLPYQRLAITQQESPFFGQSMAGLVFLPITSFFDHTVLQQLHMNDPNYFNTVGPHEIAHQWWGNTVGWISYRDQWMGEGFAEFSASLFLQAFYKDGSYDKFWDKELELLTEKDREGFRSIDVGPVTLGYRLASTRAGFSVPRRLIYPKGAYILNMIRMMMWDNHAQDSDFKKLMHDFLQFYTNRPATTEDFKLAVEKHMNSSMNLTSDGKMDWFFDEYVYGTALPAEKLSYTFSNSPDGSVALNFKLVQSGVDQGFRMTIPIYIELAEGGFYRVGSVPLTGNTTFENHTVLRGLKTRPKRALINYYHDVLCTLN
jgi:peptidase M1-like protein